MTDRATWSVLGSEVVVLSLSNPWETLYAEQRNGRSVGWVWLQQSAHLQDLQQLEKIFEGLKLTRSPLGTVPKNRVAWVVVGQDAIDQVWPEPVDVNTVYETADGPMIAAPHVKQMMQDRKQKAIFWKRWCQLLQWQMAAEPDDI